MEISTAAISDPLSTLNLTVLSDLDVKYDIIQKFWGGGGGGGGKMGKKFLIFYNYCVKFVPIL